MSYNEYLGGGGKDAAACWKYYCTVYFPSKHVILWPSRKLSTHN